MRPSRGPRTYIHPTALWDRHFNMRLCTLLAASLVLFFAISLTPAESTPASYFEDDGVGLEDYSENEIDSLLDAAQKRGCVRRGGNCDHRPTGCCNDSSCRCNLWGANCRCQRRGLFQKFGK
ncbi:uncharacterized protein LOC106669797 isoform X2 [Cimex lectularius]|uniref:U8-agatoxin-Ao1a n=1 Tax=Cimex lectularius TaxID=79782 RepID=A0A8I6RZ43_CIMLE|nr:uncharacterized protein LOC106669797 isoform X2 [Cimex lectularius]